MRNLCLLLLALLLGACGIDPIAGTWRSADLGSPSVILDLDHEGAGVLILDEVVYLATVQTADGHRYIIEQCSIDPQIDPTCDTHLCEFDTPTDPFADPWNDDPFDTWEDGPDYTTLLCEFDGVGRWLYLE